MQTVKKTDWDFENDRVLVVAARWAEPTALKHHMYICQNERTFRPSRYMAFYNEGRIRYLFELVDVPYHDCNIHNTPILKTIDDLENPEEPRQVMYLKQVANVGPIENDTVDKHGNTQGFTRCHRYTTLDKIMKSKKTSELIEESELVDE